MIHIKPPVHGGSKDKGGPGLNFIGSLHIKYGRGCRPHAPSHNSSNAEWPVKAMTPNFTVALLLAFIFKTPWVNSISCYECNRFPNEKQRPCPAKQVVDYGFQYDVSPLNLFKTSYLLHFLFSPELQACVIYQLETSRIVYQHGVLSTSPNGPCTKNQTELMTMMRKVFKVEKSHIMCCKSHGCNIAIPRSIRGKSIKHKNQEGMFSSLTAGRYKQIESSAQSTKKLTTLVVFFAGMFLRF